MLISGRTNFLNTQAGSHLAISERKNVTVKRHHHLACNLNSATLQKMEKMEKIGRGNEEKKGKKQ